MENGTQRSYLLRFLVPQVPADRLADIVAEAGRLGDDGDRGRVVAALAPRVPRSLLPGLLRLCQEIDDPYGAFETLVQLAEAAPGDIRREVIDRALSAVTAPSPNRIWSLEQLLPHLDTGQFTLAAAIAGRLGEADQHRAQVCLGNHATDDVRVGLVERAGDPVAVIRAWLTRSRTADPQRRAELLTAAGDAVADIDDPGQRLALSIELLQAGEYADAGVRAEQLVAEIRESGGTAAAQASTAASVIPFLPADERPAAVDYCLTRMREELDELGPTLDAVAAQLRPMHYMPYEDTLRDALSKLFPQLAAFQYSTVLGIIRDIRQENVRQMALTEFARCVPGAVTVPGEYFDVASTFTRKRWWADAHRAGLSALAEGPQRPLAIDFMLAQLRQPTSDGAALWPSLIPHLNGTELLSVFEILASSPDAGNLDTVILDSLLLRQMSVLADVTEALPFASLIGTPVWQVHALTDLAERSDAMGAEPEFLRIAGQLGADTALLPVAALLPDEQCRAVLDAAALEYLDGTSVGHPQPLLLDYLADMPAARRRALWQQAALTLAGGRGTVFSRIQSLAPFIGILAGEEVRLDTATAILDVLRWWP